MNEEEIRKVLEEKEERPFDLDDAIKYYGSYVDHYEVSPFEHMDAWLTRDKIEKYQDMLNDEQRKKLHQYDRILIQNAEKMRTYFGNVFDFENNTHDPLEYWWWHLDKVTKDIIVPTFKERK